MTHKNSEAILANLLAAGSKEPSSGAKLNSFGGCIWTCLECPQNAVVGIKGGHVLIEGCLCHLFMRHSF